MKKVAIILCFICTFTTYAIDLNSFINSGSFGWSFGSSNGSNLHFSVVDFHLYDRDSHFGLTTNLITVETVEESETASISFMSSELWYNLLHVEEMFCGPYADISFSTDGEIIADTSLGIKYNFSYLVGDEIFHISPTVNLVDLKLGYSLKHREFQLELTTDLALIIYGAMLATFDEAEETHKLP